MRYVQLNDFVVSKAKLGNSFSSAQFMLSYYPLDTGHKLNAHKTFRRHPGRFLNVLHTFNLCLVSRGYEVRARRDRNRNKGDLIENVRRSVICDKVFKN